MFQGKGLFSEFGPSSFVGILEKLLITNKEFIFCAKRTAIKIWNLMAMVQRKLLHFIKAGWSHWVYFLNIYVRFICSSGIFEFCTFEMMLTNQSDLHSMIPPVLHSFLLTCTCIILGDDQTPQLLHSRCATVMAMESIWMKNLICCKRNKERGYYFQLLVWTILNTADWSTKTYCNGNRFTCKGLKGLETNSRSIIGSAKWSQVTNCNSASDSVQKATAQSKTRIVMV
jgi:hypothetical protein